MYSLLGRGFTVTDDRIATEADVVTKLSARLVHDTTAKLTALISANAKGMKPFAVIDQADEGQTKVSYYAPAALAASHHLTADLAANLAGINALTDTLAAS